MTTLNKLKEGEPSRLGCLALCAGAIVLLLILRAWLMPAQTLLTLPDLCPKDTLLYMEMRPPAKGLLTADDAPWLPARIELMLLQKGAILLETCQSWAYATIPVGGETGSASREQVILLRYASTETATKKLEEYKAQFGGPQIGVRDRNGFHSQAHQNVLILASTPAFAAFLKTTPAESPRLSQVTCTLNTCESAAWFYATPGTLPPVTAPLFYAAGLARDKACFGTVRARNGSAVIEITPLTAPTTGRPWWHWVLGLLLAPFALIVGLLGLLLLYTLIMGAYFYFRQWRAGAITPSTVPAPTELSPELKEDLNDNPLRFSYQPPEEEGDSDS